MAKTVEYEGYTVQSRPYYDTNWNKWQIRIVIPCKSPQGTQTREFSSMVLYETEQEADIHGVSFGQHLIDGKVEGQSIVDMKMEDRRAMPRLRVQFRTTFADTSKLEGSGVVHDLSLGGCRIESPGPMVPGFTLELRIYVPEIEGPIMIEAASVQWVNGLMFGLAFFRLKEDERQRLEQLIHHLMDKQR